MEDLRDPLLGAMHMCFYGLLILAYKKKKYNLIP